MRPELYREIMQIYNEKQTRAKRLSVQREAEVYAVIPRIGDIDRELMSLNISLAKLFGYSTDMQARSKLSKDFRERAETLLKEKTSLLKEKGYPSDYLENVYECPLCRDTGFVEDKECICFKALVREKLFAESDLKSENEGETFDSFSLDYYSDAINPKLKISERKYMEGVLNRCKSFAENPKGNMLFTGSPGLGKSFLCHAVAKAVLEKGENVVCESAFSLFDKLIKDRFGREADSDYKNSVFNAHLLIIDDLGTENINSASSAELFNIINYRLVNKKPVIISSNLSLAEIKQSYSERIFSRLLGEYKVIPFFGSDIRALKRKENR